MASTSLLDAFQQVLGDDQLKQLGQQLGTDQQTTQKAVGTALPTLLEALTRNASQQDGAEALHGTLSRDHDGSVLDNLEGVFSGASTGGGDAILGHILGGKRDRVEQGLSQASGLDAASIGKLLTTLAPVVLGVLGRRQREQNLDAGDLSGMLNQERDQIKEQAPEQTGLLDRLLDMDQDGDFDINDMLKMGAGFLGKMFKQQ